VRARDVWDTGRPRHAWRFRKVREWLAETSCPGQFIAPNTFNVGTYSRAAANVLRRKFLLVESDTLGRDEIGAIFRWLDFSVGLRLRAIVDTAGKSLHGWFDYPDPRVFSGLEQWLPGFGCDPAMFNPAQPVSVTGCTPRRAVSEAHLYPVVIVPRVMKLESLPLGKITQDIVAQTPEPKLTPITDLPLPDVYYDGRNFYIPNSSGGWVAVNKSSARQFLISIGFSGQRDEDEVQAQADAMILRIQTEHDVVFVGPLAGHPAGLCTVNEAKILVTSSPKFIEPKPGEFQLLDRLLKNLLGETQLIYFYGWLKVALEMFRTRVWQPGQVLALCGPVGAGKNLLRQIITALLGGRVAFPHSFMTGRTAFSSDLFGAETLAIEDQQESIDIHARRHFGAAIKDMAVNKDQRCDRKHCEALTLVPLRRVVVSMNDDPERIQVLPPLDDDVADKMTLFKVHKHPMPMPTRTALEKDAFWRALENEFPMFVHFLDQWEIPEEIRCDRYGVIHYHDPDLVDLLRGTSPEGHLAEMIEDYILDGLPSKYWEGTASELETELSSEKSQCYAKARKLLTHSNSCGTYLGRLERQRPDWISRRTESGKTIWRITNYKYIIEQDNRARLRRETAHLRRRHPRLAAAKMI
jgi:hypothetical protein